VTPSPEEELRIYTLMVRSRAFEELAISEAAAGRIPGSWMSGVGQEGVVSALAQLRPDDCLTYTHRGAYPFMSRGCDPGRLLAELRGKRDGFCKGKGGRHVADLEHGIFGKSGTIGGHAPIAVGLATAIQIRGGDQVVASLFGEGTATRGTTHPAMNAAAVAKLPLVWICENNGYVGAVPASAYNAVPDVARMADSYGMPGVTVDGNDALAVWDAARQAIERARRGDGPSLVELRTYRMRAFSENSRDIRDPDEIEAWRERDPVERLRHRLIVSGLLSEAEDEALRDTARREMEAARAFAEASPFPDPAEAFEDLYG
jgi:TPP-dependent pyruvate/acetoin dehydrogenase alpha subunit